jgi:nucleotide-binding universal stress UspA family protein
MYLNRILVTTDFSETSVMAFGFAQLEARAARAEMTLLNVVENPFVSIPLNGYTPLPIYAEGLERSMPELKAQARHRLEEFAVEHFGGMQLNLAAIQATQSIAKSISIYAAENKCGLIVMASQGKGFVQRMLIGSVAEELARISQCPLMIVPSKENLATMPGKLQRILTTTDFSEDSEYAFRYAAAEAKMNQAAVTIGFVLDQLFAPELVSNLRLWSGDEARTLQDHYLKAVSDKLSNYAAEHFPMEAVSTAIIDKTFSVANSISEYAVRARSDLIVLSTHGAGRRFNLLGGVAERVIRHAPCPVLIVRRPGAGITPAAQSPR